LYYEPVVIYCMVYHYTKRVMLARLLANESPAIYVVHLNRYFVISLCSHFSVTDLLYKEECGKVLYDSSHRL